MKTTYEVRFILYHYNSGDGRNGHYPHSESFGNVEEAKWFRDKLNLMLSTKESTREFASEYCWDGFLERIDGIYEITEKKLS